MNVQELILKHLVFSEEYLREVLPFLKEEYFSSPYKEIFVSFEAFFSRFHERPSVDALEISLENKLFSENDKKKLDEFLEELKKEEGSFVPKNIEWLISETEKFCKDKAIECAIRKSVSIITGTEKTLTREAIPDLLKEAISISFDRKIGHDYFNDFENRYEYYTRKVEKYPFDIDFLNKITNGGIARKTLNIFVGGVNVGKTLTLCHIASSYLKSLYNVLYITMEMSEEEISKRIDANLLDVPINELNRLPKETYSRLIENVKRNIPRGNLIIKEFPTAVPTVNHFKKLLMELKAKKDYVPDIIIVDYMNICSSVRIRNMNADSPYMLVKAVAEELRGLAMEENVPLITATQLNRAGFAASDVDMTNIADSFGIAMTADLIVSLINNEKMEKTNVIMMKQLKNRYGDVTINKKAYVGISRAKMRLFNVEQNIDLDSDLVDSVSNDKEKNSESVSPLSKIAELTDFFEV
ncbi:MAG: AAA family ATPase [Patescibacteria group bacterium]|nr:AAA family ATPase [Patescibacteria group bacterium]